MFTRTYGDQGPLTETKGLGLKILGAHSGAFRRTPAHSSTL
jgi:hypothetical protein